MNKSLILNRVKSFFQFHTDVELAAFLGISKSTLSNWYKRNTIDYDLLFSKCEQIDKNWLLTGGGEIQDYKSPEVQILHTPDYAEKKDDQSIILYNVNAAANLKTLFNNPDQNILGKISVPDIPACDGAIYVNGDSMYPLLKSGDIIAYKEIKSFDFVAYGEIYIVSFEMGGDEYITIKYVNKSDQDGYITLSSYNSHHAPQEIPTSAINAMALVKLSIRKHSLR